jgi:hypothetical protein
MNKAESYKTSVMVSQPRPGCLHWAQQFNLTRPQLYFVLSIPTGGLLIHWGLTCGLHLCLHILGGGGNWIHLNVDSCKKISYAESTVQWQGSWPDRTELDKTQRLIGLNTDELQFVNLFSANKVAILCSVDLIIFVKLFYWNYSGYWGLHFGHPCSAAFKRQGNFTKHWVLGTGLVCVSLG